MATKKAEADAARAAKAAAQGTEIHNATLRREQFEKANPSRFTQITDLPGGQAGAAHSYHSMGIGVAPEHGDTSHGQMEFPGVGHTAVVRTPPKWEELAPKQQERITSNLATYGVTHESAKRALGAQVDKGALWEAQNTPSGRHHSFYTAEGTSTEGTIEPRTRMVQSAKENSVPFEQQAVANAITSPKSKFSTKPKSGPNAGQRIYPNDLNASAAIKSAQEGKPDEARAVPGIGGLHGNSIRAAHVVSKMRGGASAAEAWKAGPKTGPYHNSWVDPHGPNQYWVSDIHSGGGGIAPHLSIGEHEKMLGVAGVHSFNDHVARSVMKERGIQSMTGMQSMQWNQQRRERSLHDIGAHSSQQPQLHGQMDLFGGAEHHAPVNHAQFRSHEDFKPSIKDEASAIAVSQAAGKKAALQRIKTKKVPNEFPSGPMGF